MLFGADDAEEKYLCVLCLGDLLNVFLSVAFKQGKYIRNLFSGSFRAGYVARVCSCALTFSGINASGNFVCDLSCMEYSQGPRMGHFGWGSVFRRVRSRLSCGIFHKRESRFMCSFGFWFDFLISPTFAGICVFLFRLWGSRLAFGAGGFKPMLLGGKEPESRVILLRISLTCKGITLLSKHTPKPIWTEKTWPAESNLGFCIKSKNWSEGHIFETLLGRAKNQDTTRHTIRDTLLDTLKSGDTTPDTPVDTLSGHLTISGYSVKREKHFISYFKTISWFPMQSISAPSQPWAMQRAAIWHHRGHQTWAAIPDHHTPTPKESDDHEQSRNQINNLGT